MASKVTVAEASPAGPRYLHAEYVSDVTWPNSELNFSYEHPIKVLRN